MRKYVLALWAATLATALQADVKLPAIFSDNMMLQAGKPLPIWGTADAGEQVTVKAGPQAKTVAADENGKWKVTLDAVPAGDVGEIAVSGKNTLTVKNVIAGSVWVCSGQSNMQFQLRGDAHAATEILAANYPQIRYFAMPNSVAFEPKSDSGGKWIVCSPQTAHWFSAVAYFFGKELHAATGSPVGLIGTSWGGTPAQSWTSLDGLAKEPMLKTAYAERFEQAKAALPHEMEKFNREIKPKNDAAWKQFQEESARAKSEGKPAPKMPPMATAPDKNPQVPSVLYNAMIAPLIPYAIEGAIWYQGESNGYQGLQYRTLFPRMISDWREKWGQGDFPFYFVQLANYQAPQKSPSEGGWGMLREAQLMTLKLPNTGMAVTIDIGAANDIHPTDKRTVGKRLALWALRDVFKKQDLVVSGPLYDSMKVEGSKIRLSFKHMDGGLIIGAAPATRPSVPATQPLSELKGFAIAGADKKFVWAQAQIDGETVVVWSDEVAQPVAVRYGWAMNPFLNLYNKANLPASPFRTDDWDK